MPCAALLTLKLNATLAIVLQPLNEKLQLLSNSSSIRRMLRSRNLRSLATPALVFVAYVLPAALILHAILFWSHGIIDSEAMEFILNYLQKRPFLSTIFDPQINDWGAYQARELSYVFDWIDARVFAALLDRHVLIFIPLSGLLGLIALSGVYFFGARKVLALSRLTTGMLLSLFLSCIVVQASTPILYRSSKIILSVVLLGYLFYLAALLKIDKRELTLLKSAALFCLAVITALCDRQGFYYLISATLIILMFWVPVKIRRPPVERAYLRLALINACAIITTIFYNRIFAPWLIHALNGYWPNFSYQNFPSSKLLDPTLPAKAFHIFADQVSFFFGNLPFVLVVALAAAVLFWKRRSIAKIDNLRFIAVFVVSILALIGLLAAMIARHPAIYKIQDHEFWYYTLTLHVVFLFGITAWLSFMEPNLRDGFKSLLYFAVAILIALNFRSYGEQRQVMIHSTGWFDGQYAHSQALVEQFKTNPPLREKLQSRSSDLFLDDQAHFLENVELSYLHLVGAMHIESTPRR